MHPPALATIFERNPFVRRNVTKQSPHNLDIQLKDDVEIAVRAPDYSQE